MTPPTVPERRETIANYLAFGLHRFRPSMTGAACQAEAERMVDALIAAVRADAREALDTAPGSSHTSEPSTRVVQC